METKFNFNSQICTTREQSERLLALGLRKETADMYWWQETDQYGDGNGKWHRQLLDLKEDKEHFKYLDKTFGVCLDVDTDEQFFIPAWSLNRLLSLLPKEILCEVENGLGMYFGDENAVSYFGVLGYYTHANLYDAIILCIEDVIKEGYFPKEYLV